MTSKACEIFEDISKNRNSRAWKYYLFDKSTSQAKCQLCIKIKNEMKIFESHPYHKRPETLEKIFLSLKSIPPSSVEAERAFSSTSFFSTKMRGNLSDETLTSLVF